MPLVTHNSARSRWASVDLWLRAVLLSASICVVIGGSSACLQDEGERCQVDGDCSGDLMCCIRKDDVRVGFGTCRLEDDCELTPRDAGTDIVTADATSTDGVLPDAAADLPTPDATIDAGADAEPDAEVDATVDAEADAEIDATGDVS